MIRLPQTLETLLSPQDLLTQAARVRSAGLSPPPRPLRLSVPIREMGSPKLRLEDEYSMWNRTLRGHNGAILPLPEAGSARGKPEPERVAPYPTRGGPSSRR